MTLAAPQRRDFHPEFFRNLHLARDPGNGKGITTAAAKTSTGFEFENQPVKTASSLSFTSWPVGMAIARSNCVA